MTNISYAKAINLALKESMKDNKSVFCIAYNSSFFAEHHRKETCNKKKQLHSKNMN